VKQARRRYRSTVIPAYIVAYARFSFPVPCTTEAQHRFVASAKRFGAVREGIFPLI
jgi:hypothetical protein